MQGDIGTFYPMFWTKVIVDYFSARNTSGLWARSSLPNSTLTRSTVGSDILMKMRIHPGHTSAMESLD